MQYLLDTVAVVRHFTGSGKIGKKAVAILDSQSDSNHVFMISVISLMEIMYLAEKKRISIHFNETLDRLERSSSYVIIDLNKEILKAAHTFQFPDLHDRLIIATAKWLDVPVISSDQQFASVEGVDVVW